MLAQIGTLLRPETTEAFSSFSANSAQGELKLPQQESVDQAWLAQTVVQYLQEMILGSMGAVVLVVLNSNGGSRPSSLQKRLLQGKTTRSEDCCDEYPTQRVHLRQRKGA
jgi:hypothetical protein